MTDSERSLARNFRAELHGMTQPSDRTELFGLITKMLLTYPVANASAQSGAARGEAYLEALGDMPAHVLDGAIRRWNRGEAGDGHDYRWAPAPAVLRAVCRDVLRPLNAAIAALDTLLSAITLDRAMDCRPIEGHETEAPKLRRMA